MTPGTLSGGGSKRFRRMKAERVVLDTNVWSYGNPPASAGFRNTRAQRQPCTSSAIEEATWSISVHVSAY